MARVRLNTFQKQYCELLEHFAELLDKDELNYNIHLFSSLNIYKLVAVTRNLSPPWDSFRSFSRGEAALQGEEDFPFPRYKSRPDYIGPYTYFIKPIFYVRAYFVHRTFV